jgi:uncharacterized membrane protein
VRAAIDQRRACRKEAGFVGFLPLQSVEKHMANATGISQRPPRRIAFKHWAFLALGLMTLVVLYNNERFIVLRSGPDWDYFFPIRWWLLPHGLAGALALIIGPMQFSTRLRQRYPQFHRILGRIYVVGAVVGAPMGIVLTFTHHLPLAIRVQTFAQSGSWLLTTGVAFFYILSGNVVRHRQWMRRSYLFPCIFIVGRVLDRIPFLGSFLAPFNNNSDPAVLWFLVLFAWVVPTFLEQKEELFGTR